MPEVTLHNNLDFIYLFYGAAFFFLGTASLVLYFQQKSKKALPWFVLSLFGFIHGFNVWLDMIAISRMDSRFLELARHMILTASFLFLVEFFRQSIKVLKNIRIRPFVYIPLIALAVVIFLSSACWSCLTASVCYTLGFIPVLLISYVFWCYSSCSEDRFSQILFKSVAILFGLYAVATGLIVPRAFFWPATLLNEATFLQWTRIPIQFFRGLCATIIAFLFTYKAVTLTSVTPIIKKGAQSIKFILISLLLLYCCFLYFGFEFVFRVEQHEKVYLKKMILSDARLFAYALGEVDNEVFGKIRTETIYRKYRQMHERMVELADNAPFTKSLYLVSLRDGEPTFVVGSQAQIFPLDIVPAFGGRIPKKMILDAFHSKLPTIDGPYEDIYGRPSFSLFIPLLDQRGEVLSLLGIDLDGFKVQMQLLRIRLYVIFIVMAFLILLIVGYAFLVVFALKNLELEVEKYNLDMALASLKVTKAELARSEETFRGILNNSPNAIFGFDRDLRIIFWNQGAERLYGYPKDEVVIEKNPLQSKKITDLFGMEDVEFKLQKVFRGEMLQHEIAHKTKEGRADVVMTLFPVKDPQGHILFGMGLIQDITERKRMELSLFEERQRLRRIADSIGAGLSLIDKNFQVVWVNETMESWFGRIGSIQGRKCYEAYRARHGICEGCPTKKTFETGQMHSSEHRVVLPNGKTMDFQIISSPIRGEYGEVEQVLEMILDISDKRRMIELLEYERALSKNVIDSIGDMLMVLDCQTRKILDVNKEFLRVHQQKREDVIGKRCNEVLSYISPPCQTCAFDEVVSKGRVISTTHIHTITTTGKKFYEDVTLSPLKDEKGKIIGVIHLARDVTDRKQLEDELRRYSESLEALVKERTKALEKSESMFRRLFESAQDGILIIDVESGRIIDVNPYILNLLECRREEVSGFDYRSVPFFIDTSIFERVFNELKNKPSVFYSGVALKTRAEKEITVELWASQYYVEDRKIIQCNIRDITERKKLEQMKSEFVSMVSHELRTPLSSIKEGVEIVADGTQGKLNKSQKECLGIALSNIQRLNRMIGDILDISKIQSNLLKVDIVPCNVYEVIDQVYGLVRIEIEKRGMVFVTDVEKNLPAAMADKDRLIQVLMNLLNNAVKFTRERSKITLLCRRIGDFIEFAVKDEGAGIPPDELSQLFKRFVQLDSTLVRRVSGTGLGLYISRNLIEAMGGKIWAESKMGEGSIFKFTIPIEKEGV